MILSFARLPLHWQILIALLLAIATGLIAGKDATLFTLPLLSIFDFMGALFLSALKMLIVPLVMASIIVGTVGLGSGDHLGRLGIKTIFYYFSTTLLAVLTGLLLVQLLAPGLIDGQPAKEVIGLSADVSVIEAKLADKGADDIADIFLRMVPDNIVMAAAEGQMLGLIFFSLLFGYFLIFVPGEPGASLRHFWQGVLGVMMRMTHLVMGFAPLGVFALVAKVVATTGLAAFKPLLFFFITVLLGLLLHFLFNLALILRFVARVNPFLHLRAMTPALLTAFSTSSSSATLPVTLDCVEKRAGVSNKVGSFVLPLGATINMDGTALYECVVVLFIAQAYGVDLSFAAQFGIVMLAVLTSIGVAGIPSASLVAISVILAAVGLPLEGIGLILVVDRILDMCRTAVNIYSDSVGAMVMARLEGEKNFYP